MGFDLLQAIIESLAWDASACPHPRIVADHATFQKDLFGARAMRTRCLDCGLECWGQYAEGGGSHTRDGDGIYRRKLDA